MSDLYYEVSRGCGSMVRAGEIYDSDFGVPNSTSDKEFRLIVFGHPINPAEAKNPLFRCRDLLAYMLCYSAGADRDLSKSSVLDDAVSCVSTYVPDSRNKNLVIIEVGELDISSPDVNDLLDNLHKIIERESGMSDVVVCWHLSINELGAINNHKSWGTEYKIVDDDSHRALLLWK